MKFTSLAGLISPLLFLKATVKKKIWIPQFTKKNGQVVGGHYASVHVTDDHDVHKVASGKGSYSQKKAHAALAKEDAFHELSAEDKAALVQHHATEIQDTESMTARLATLKKKLLGGAKPTAGEWKYFHAAPADKKAAITAAVHAAGHGAAMDSQYADYVATAPAAPPEEADPPPPVKAAQEPAKPAPEPKAAEPKADAGPLTMPEFSEGTTAKGVKAYYEKVAQKIIDHANAGNLAVLEDMPNPEKGNTWKGKTGNSKALMALHAAAIAHVKAANGEPNAVAAPAPEQLHPSLAAHDASIKDAIAEEDAKAAKKAAAVAKKQQSDEAKEAAHVAGKQLEAEVQQAGYPVKYFEGVGVMVSDGPHAKAFYSAESAKTEIELLAAHGWEASTDGGSPAYVKITGKIAAPAPSAAPEPAPAPAPAAEGVDSLSAAMASEIKSHKVDPSNTNAKSFNPKVDAIAAAVEAGDIAALQAMKFGSNTYGKKCAKLTAQALAFLGAAKPGLKVVSASYVEPAPETPPAAATPAAAASSAPPFPAKPEGVPSGQQTLVDDAYAAGQVGDLETLNEMLDYANNSGMVYHKVKEYIDEVSAHVINHGSASQAHAAAAKPVPPTGLSSMKTELVENITAAIAAKELVTIKNIQESLTGLESFATVVKYADEAMAYLQANGDAPAAAAPAPAAEEGPKEGDTKQGADGMLVFENGRWHKMGTDPAVLKQKAASVPMPKLTGKHALKMGATMKQLKALAEAQGGAGLADVVSVTPGGMIKINAHALAEKTGVKTQNWVSLNPGGGQGANAQSLANYAKDLLATMEGTTGGAGATIAAPAPKAPNAAAASKPSAPAAATIKLETEKVGKLSVMIADKWEQTGPQKGSNPGGKFKDAKGDEWYCKFPTDPDAVKNELLAGKFYEMLGAKVPSLRLVKKDGKLGIASKWVDGISKGTPEQLASADGAHAGFVFDAWLANWDVVGMGHDNLLLDKDGKALRVDVGGSLIYRAMGGKKGDAFGDEVTELSTLIDAGKNSQSASVFAGIKQADLAAGAGVLAKMHPNQIRKLCHTFGPGSRAEQDQLAAKLTARREYILKRLGIEDPWNKPPLDETALPVNQNDLPSPIDFSNYHGAGKGLSTKEHLNKQNSIDDAALIAFAQKGNLKALKEYEYEAFDKETGASLGKKPIAQHPSKDIKNHWAALCDLLSSVAHPPVDGLDLPPIGGGSIEEVSEAAGYIKPGETIKSVSSDKVLGFWMKLGHVGADSIAELMPAKVSYLKSDFVSKAKKWYAAASKATQDLVNEVLDSSHGNRFWSNGVKHITLKKGWSGGAQSLATQVYQDAMEITEGVQVGRWMGMSDAMIGQLMKEGPGLVIQNTDSMCTSIFKNWGEQYHFDSKVFVNITFAKGAKAMASLGSGRYSSTEQDAEGNYIYSQEKKGEMEVTTLMGQRYVVLGIKQGNSANTKGITLDLLALPPHEGYLTDIKEMAALGKSFAANAMRKMVLFTKMKK